MASGTLIVHPGALGDVLQAVPALLGLRAAAAGRPLAFAGQPRLGRLLVELDVVDEARAFDGLGLSTLFTDAPIPEALAELTRRFARVVSWFGSRDATYRARLAALGPETIVAPPVPADDTPVWRHLVSTLGLWAISPPEPLAPLRVAERAPTRPTLVVHPGSGGAWKRWPVARYAEVIHAIREGRSLDVIVHQGPADAEEAERLLALLAGHAIALIEPELPRLAAVLGTAHAYLGGDSGVSHLAAAVGAPAVILFPPATRRRWQPWSPTARPIEMTEEVADAARVLRELGSLLPTSR
ncbi:MAG TPA: glycosyltransferase family 9 protein [Methylomirabilota bacterium]|nr:glycosyltransferase family 9 protein [Methylomirabilota bacterium]